MPEPRKSSKAKPKSELHRDRSADIAFGTILRRYRLERGFTQEQLAWETKIERAFISELERGVKGPSLLTIMRLARVLQVLPGDLVNEAEGMLSKSPKR